MRFAPSRARALAVLLALAPGAPAAAAERGRTDGPEGAEIGAGGYASTHERGFGLALQWGAALADDHDGSPLFVGAGAQYRLDDPLLLEAASQYVWRTQSVNLLIGPRLRTATYPLGFGVGLQAGAVILDDERVRFLLSPQASAELPVSDHLLVGLNYALDVPLGVDQLTHRVYLGVTYAP